MLKYSSLGAYWRQAFIIMIMLVVSGCGESVLFSKLTEHQANEVEAALMAADISANKVLSEDRENWSVMIPRESFPKAVALLEERGLPRKELPSMHEIFPKEGFVSSPLEERARYIYALSQELSHTLLEIDGVVSARVHVALPEKAILDDEQESASVSVVIVQEPDVDLSAHKVDIKAIVTDGIEGLDDVNKVTVRFFKKRKVDLAQYDAISDEKVLSKEVYQAGIGGTILGMCLLGLIFTVFNMRKQKKAAPKQRPALK